MKNLANSPRHPYAKHIKYVSQIAMKIGLIVSISLCILAFNWTTYDINEMPPIVTIEVPKEIPITRTVQKKRSPPPPVVEPSTEILPDDDMDYNPEPEPELVVDKVIVGPKAEPTELPPAPVVEKKKVVPAPLPEPELPVVEVVVHDFVEEMPRFTGCEDMKDDKAGRRLCAEQKLMAYIYSNIKYPSIARENGVEGLVVIQFVVAKDGSIGKVKIAKDVGAGCAKEAARVLKNMPKWIPGKQGGKAVNVRFNIPVKFKLK